MDHAHAPHLLTVLAGLPPAERRAEVHRVLLRVWETPQVLLHEITPTRAVTAVAVVAASLPGARGRPWVDGPLAAAALPGVDPGLVGRALSALDVVVGRDPESVRLELPVTDREAARALLDDLRRVLVDGLRAAAG